MILATTKKTYVNIWAFIVFCMYSFEVFEKQFVRVEYIESKHIPAGDFSSNTTILY